MTRKALHLKRKFKGSAYLQARNSEAISSNSKLPISLDERFKPYDDVIVTSLNSDNDATITVNFNVKQPLPKGNKAKIDIPVENIEITNDGTGSISANQIEVYYRNTGALGKEMLSKASQIATIGTLVRSVVK